MSSGELSQKRGGAERHTRLVMHRAFHNSGDHGLGAMTNVQLGSEKPCGYQQGRDHRNEPYRLRIAQPDAIS